MLKGRESLHSRSDVGEFKENAVNVDGGGLKLSPSELGLSFDDDGGGAGARTTHFPSVSHSATAFTFLPHCPRNFSIFASSIHPEGISNVRAVCIPSNIIDFERVGDVITEKEEEEEEADSDSEMRSSVAPTLQCAGYTGIAYASTNLYVSIDVLLNTRLLGGKLVKLVRICL